MEAEISRNEHLPEAATRVKKEALTQVFSCEFCEIFKNTFFTEHLWATASYLMKVRKTDNRVIHEIRSKLLMKIEEFSLTWLMKDTQLFSFGDFYLS